MPVVIVADAENFIVSLYNILEWLVFIDTDQKRNLLLSMEAIDFAYINAISGNDEAPGEKDSPATGIKPFFQTPNECTEK